MMVIGLWLSMAHDGYWFMVFPFPFSAFMFCFGSRMSQHVALTSRYWTLFDVSCKRVAVSFNTSRH